MLAIKLSLQKEFQGRSYNLLIIAFFELRKLSYIETTDLERIE